MTSQRLSLIALAFATTLSAGHALASDAPKTREQVRAELAEARRAGTLIADGQTGATFRDLAPHRHETAVTAQGKTRADVRAEYEAARRNGDLIADGETGATFRQLAPHRYPVQADAVAGARAQVRDALAQSRRASGAPSAN